jgi:hypothetical protein
MVCVEGNPHFDRVYDGRAYIGDGPKVSLTPIIAQPALGKTGRSAAARLDR